MHPQLEKQFLNVPEETVKSPPKFNIAIALSLAELLYINAPLAVNDALVHVGSSASKNAVVPLVDTAPLFVNVTPPVA